MMKKSWTKWILAAAIALVLIVGVPIIDNKVHIIHGECDAAIVLRIYGNLEYHIAHLHCI